MELEIKKMPGYKVVGLLYTGKNENQEISALWGQFNERGEELCPRGTKVCYGICRVPGQESLAKGKLSFSGPEEQNAGDTPVDFEYVAGVQYKEGQPLPKGTVIREVSECTVAVFKHVGAANTLTKPTTTSIAPGCQPQPTSRWNPVSTWRCTPMSSHSLPRIR